MDLNKLLVTQHGLRNLEQLPAMVAAARNGVLFTNETLVSYAIINDIRPSPLIEIAEFEDGARYIHNGHHRAVAIYIGRHSQRLFPEEFFVRKWKYSDYTDIVLPHWVTPFDPRIETRCAELKGWKQTVNTFLSDEDKIQFIRGYNLYSQKRKLYTVGDLANEINKAV